MNSRKKHDEPAKMRAAKLPTLMMDTCILCDFAAAISSYVGLCEAKRACEIEPTLLMSN